MPTRTTEAAPSKFAHRGVGFRFWIDAFTPTTIPMARLSGYMYALAELLGETEHVHFSRLTHGSLSLHMRVDREAVPKVRARADAVRDGIAPSDAMNSYRAVNKMLREDNGTGRFKQTDERGKLLYFPGRDQVLSKPIIVRQRGTVEGQLIRVGGADRTAHLTLQLEDQRQSNCVVTRALGKKIAPHLFDFVRVNGIGRWVRDENGDWEIIEFKVDGFELLDNAPLSKALADLRTLADNWDPVNASQKNDPDRRRARQAHPRGRARARNEQ
jgi:hypothetical protein